MDILCQCLRFHILFIIFLLGMLLCLHLEWWANQRKTLGSLPLRRNDTSFDFKSDLTEEAGSDDGDCWRAEYESRVQRVRDTCKKDENSLMRRFWRVLENHPSNGVNSYCPTKLCPIIVKEEQQPILFCFIPKVASSHVKRFFLKISNITINDTLENNGTAMHIFANDALLRISPRLIQPSSDYDSFYKIIFVRHPFDRLVSAFRSKAERSRDEVPYFYCKYWDPIMKLRPRDSTLDQITFEEFVWYLMHTDKRGYDEHWAPYWSRCNPCLVNYDFIGKLETAEHDFLYTFREARIEFNPEWWIGFQPTPHSVTLEYFAVLPEDMIRSLYEIYKLDFELFGYSLDEFLPGNFTES